jgi:hypothetical protein
LIVKGDAAFNAPVIIPGSPDEPTTSTPEVIFNTIGVVSVEALYPAAVARVRILTSVAFDVTSKTNALEAALEPNPKI